MEAAMMQAMVAVRARQARYLIGFHPGAHPSLEHQPTPPCRNQHGRRTQVLRALPPKQVLRAHLGECHRARGLTADSLGGALTDTLDNLITERRIEPQLAMKILTNFDKAVADVLADKVKARLTFKVGIRWHAAIAQRKLGSSSSEY